MGGAPPLSGEQPSTAPCWPAPRLQPGCLCKDRVSLAVASVCAHPAQEHPGELPGLLRGRSPGAGGTVLQCA